MGRADPCWSGKSRERMDHANEIPISRVSITHCQCQYLNLGELGWKFLRGKTRQGSMSHRWQWGWSRRNGEERKEPHETTIDLNSGQEGNEIKDAQRRRLPRPGRDADEQGRVCERKDMDQCRRPRRGHMAERHERGNLATDSWREDQWRRAAHARLLQILQVEKLKKLFSVRLLETLQMDNLEIPRVAWNLLKFSKSISRDSHTNQARGKLGTRPGKPPLRTRCIVELTLREAPFSSSHNLQVDKLKRSMQERSWKFCRLLVLNGLIAGGWARLIRLDIA